jgi:tRNA (guanine37-N1)-methyltransferase
MRLAVLTLFPEYFDSFKSASIIKKAIGNTVDFEVYNIRDNSNDPGKRVDDVPFGGGSGMLLKCQPVVDTINKVKKSNSKVIYLSPRGKTLTQSKVRELAKEEDLIFLCGHYEGIDERILDYVDEELSIGDYILTGGEVATLVVLDSIIRLTEGTIREESHLDESFENGLLEYPQYTNPRVYEGKEVPSILFSGNHEAIDKWRRKESLRITRDRRKDLFDKVELSKKDKKLLVEIDNNEIGKWESNAIEKAKKFTNK